MRPRHGRTQKVVDPPPPKKKDRLDRSHVNQKLKYHTKKRGDKKIKIQKKMEVNTVLDSMRLLKGRIYLNLEGNKTSIGPRILPPQPTPSRIVILSINLPVTESAPTSIRFFKRHCLFIYVMVNGMYHDRGPKNYGRKIEESSI